MKQRLAEMQERIQAKFNSPEWKKQMEKLNSPEFKERMQEMQKKPAGRDEAAGRAAKEDAD